MNTHLLLSMQKSWMKATVEVDVTSPKQILASQSRLVGLLVLSLCLSSRIVTVAKQKMIRSLQARTSATGRTLVAFRWDFLQTLWWIQQTVPEHRVHRVGSGKVFQISRGQPRFDDAFAKVSLYSTSGSGLWIRSCSLFMIDSAGGESKFAIV